MRSYTLFLVGALCSSLTACSVARSNAASDDGDALSTEVLSPAAPSDSANSTYFRVRIDERKCAAPQCGGFYVARVNRAVTTCADGVVRPECYVADLDLGQLPLDAAAVEELRAHVNQFLLRGGIDSKGDGVLRVSEAWQGRTGRPPTGAYVRATNSGIVCITAPCPSYNAARLNSDQPVAGIAAVKFDGNRSADDAQAQLNRPEGLLLAAEPSTVSGPGGTAAALLATEYYLPYTQARGVACGARLPQCATGQFCKFSVEAQCGRADQPGVCSTPPQICTDDYTPVCGCDGQTYSNACRAAASSISVDYSGECR